MKRGMRLAAIACAAVITAAGLCGCSLGTKGSIDNQRVSVEGVKRIEVRCGVNGGVTLGTGDQEAFIRMVNGFTLADGEKSQPEVSQTAYCFDVEDKEGEVHSLQFSDRNLTVNGRHHYQISEADSKALTEYWEDYGLADMLGTE